MKQLALLSFVLLSCGEKESERELTDQGKKTAAYQVSQETSPESPDPTERAMPEESDPPPPDPEPELPGLAYFPVSEEIHALISEREADITLEPYSESIPLAGGAAFEMLPVPAGTLTIGSPVTEPGPDQDQRPQVETELAPFWIGKHEVTWDLYRAFMENGKPRNLDGTLDRDGDTTTLESPDSLDGESLADIVSQPPPPYEARHFEMGQGYAAGWPAIAMSQHAASKFCEWLSAQTGRYYRLPTEAEWEYACRAATTTTYSFGDDPEKLNDFAWTYDNCDYSYQMVGTRKPNPWGIHDMHGNVAEWCLDGHFRSVDIPVDGPPQPGHSGAVRGGSYTDKNPTESMRSDARHASDPAWNASDPRNPKSIWYLSNNEWIGFRVVRPFEVPDLSTMHSMWNTGSAASE